MKQHRTPPGRNNRHALALVTVVLLFSASGATCTRGFRNPFVNYGPPAPEVLLSGSSLDQVIAAVNQNSSRVLNYQSNDASITVPGMAGIPLLRGNIAAQQPGLIRLQASTALTGPEVDFGSNQQLFWFWVKRNEPPALYFSRHDQFVGSAAQQVMPIEPQWLLDALGLTQFSPSDQHSGPIPHGNGTLEIHSTLATRLGPMTKHTVVDASRAWVLEQYIYDATGQLVASSRTSNHRYYPEIGVSLPQKIELQLPPAQLSLSIDVRTLVLNQASVNPALFELPALAGYPQIDLGSAPAGAVSAMGPPGSNDWNTLASPSFVGLTPDAVQPATHFVAPAASQPLGSVPAATLAPYNQPVSQQLNPNGMPLR